MKCLKNILNISILKQLYTNNRDLFILKFLEEHDLTQKYKKKHLKKIVNY